MRRIFFLCICFSVSANNDIEIFQKCCPDAQYLVKVHSDETQVIQEDKFECVDKALETTDDYALNPYPSVFVTDNVIVEYAIPEGCDLKMIQYDGYDVNLSPSSNHCYDILVFEMINGTLKQVVPKTVALACNGSDIRIDSNEKIANIRKCCLPGQTYDTELHTCRSGYGGNDRLWLIEKLKSSGKIYKFDNGLDCKVAEYAVELKEEQFSIALVGNKLNVSSRSGKGGGQSPEGNWCVDREYRSRRLVARVCANDCASFGALCIRKCCPIGQHYQPLRCGTMSSQCVLNGNTTGFFDISSYIERPLKKYGIGNVQGLRIDIVCGANSTGKIAFNKTAWYDWHHLTRDGNLESNFGVNSEYCLEAFDTSPCGEVPYVTGVICLVMPKPIKNFLLSFSLHTLSAVCLALTLVVYCSIPELRNLHGKNLICHVTVMLIACSCLARVQYHNVYSIELCAALGYGIYFGYMAALAWLNVMCADIWWTFGNVRTVQGLHKGGVHRRRFLWYSLYAWGVSVSLTLTMFLLDKYPLTDVLDANMGYGHCWFGADQNTSGDWPHYIFFVIPMGLVSLVNFVLWLLTARHCARVKSEVHRLQAGSVGDRAKKRFRMDKANFVLTGKLWVVMGAGWVSELMSTLASEPNAWGWTIVDMVNELQGVFIFIILVFKPKLYYLIRKRLGLEKPDTRKNGQSSTARTSSTFLSRTVSSDERAHARVSLPNDNIKQS